MGSVGSGVTPMTVGPMLLLWDLDFENDVTVNEEFDETMLPTGEKII